MIINLNFYGARVDHFFYNDLLSLQYELGSLPYSIHSIAEKSHKLRLFMDDWCNPFHISHQWHVPYSFVEQLCRDTTHAYFGIRNNQIDI